ncbi:MarR family winged helix-turn-helix transcriptional regulator [Wenxinia marina]|nr:MarR family transcriptional regulator [Wenxinia marina]
MIRRALDDGLRPHGLNGLQYTILTLVRDRGQMSSAELSRRFFVTPQTMNESVTALERRGLIVRRESEANRRILLAEVTDEARALLRECDGIADAAERAVFGDMDRAETERLNDLLRARIARLRDG